MTAILPTTQPEPAEKAPWVTGGVGSAYAPSPALRRAYEIGAAAAASGARILIQGGPGVGKKTMARWLHRSAPGAARSMASLVCPAIPLAHVDAELFGDHSAGAEPRRGLLELAHEGVALLEEIQLLPLGIVGKLREALAVRSIRPRGADGRVPADVQLFATATDDLEALVQRGELSAEYLDLFDVRIDVPPLRERRAEIQPLVDLLLVSASQHHGRALTISPAALAILARQVWAGNIRELRAAVERACVLCPGSEIGPEHVTDKLSSSCSRS
jgi:DNA-binding NtrC family response regulator